MVGRPWISGPSPKSYWTHYAAAAIMRRHALPGVVAEITADSEASIRAA